MFVCQSRQSSGLNWRDNRGWSRIAITDFSLKTVPRDAEVTHYDESFSMGINRRMLRTNSVEDFTFVFQVVLSRYAPTMNVNIVIPG